MLKDYQPAWVGDTNLNGTVDRTTLMVLYYGGLLISDMQFTLTAVDDDGTVTTKEFQSVFLKDTVEKSADFLRGVGYFFDELSIIVNEETPYDDDTTPEFLTEQNESSYVHFSATAD
ncbi:hypothetical protein Syn7803C89_29 [Synechococcus phage ACG-2014d]|uniref:Uncharacterized protein n=1 Tax=Synechococcus phage ACG-2014d TaxID=1493509 RepID=A0A0E3F6K1_9CAUD|nr:hypothetical protein Syn7803C89_29 [Synechococcus phage ACG-2014d]AIX36231.1 hypothetical protein Syn7803US71_29 [Synechococcus phage ACG-2014d]AIX38244.1 hypothetical protein Syn7803US89_29 [Synechococcus phage ACG-2014d]